MYYVEGYKSGLIAGLIRLQVDYFTREWGFGAGFEALVAKETGAFLDRYDDRRDLILTVWRGRTMRGSIVIDGGGSVRSQLRWFVVDKSLRGDGVGKELISRAMAFVDERDVSMTYLKTFVGLDTAAALFRQHGFKMVTPPAAEGYSGVLQEQMWERQRHRLTG